MAEGNAVEICHTCGGTGYLDLLVTCKKCERISTHEYCMKIVPDWIPENWVCEDCIDHEQAANGPKEKSALGKPTHSRALSASKQLNKTCAPPQTVMLNPSSSDSGPSSSKKRRRGATTHKKLISTGVKKIDFDNLGRYVGENSANFASYLGLLARTKVNINIRDWRQVDKNLKLEFWQDIKKQWQISDDKHYKKIISHMGVLWKSFKRYLVSSYVRKGKSPLAKYFFLSEDAWKKFVEYHESEQFQVLSQKGKQNAKNEHPHFLGSGGYTGKKFKERLRAAQLSPQFPNWLINSPLLEDDRSKSWIVARMKETDSGYNIFNEKTLNVVQKINEKAKELSQGLFIPDKYHDVLGTSLPNKEHPGRVRGVGTLPGFKDYWKGQTTRRKKSQTSVADEDEIARRVRGEVEAEFKAQLQVEEERRTQIETQLRDLQNKLIGQQRDGRLMIDHNTPQISQEVECSSYQLVQPYLLDSIENHLQGKREIIEVSDGDETDDDVELLSH